MTCCAKPSPASGAGSSGGGVAGGEADMPAQRMPAVLSQQWLAGVTGSERAQQHEQADGDEELRSEAAGGWRREAGRMRRAGRARAPEVARIPCRLAPDQARRDPTLACLIRIEIGASGDAAAAARTPRGATPPLPAVLPLAARLTVISARPQRRTREQDGTAKLSGGARVRGGPRRSRRSTRTLTLPRPERARAPRGSSTSCFCGACRLHCVLTSTRPIGLLRLLPLRAAASLRRRWSTGAGKLHAALESSRVLRSGAGAAEDSTRESSLVRPPAALLPHALPPPRAPRIAASHHHTSLSPSSPSQAPSSHAAACRRSTRSTRRVQDGR
jgi:hypothetical protein